MCDCPIMEPMVNMYERFAATARERDLLRQNVEILTQERDQLRAELKKLEEMRSRKTADKLLEESGFE